MKTYKPAHAQKKKLYGHDRDDEIGQLSRTFSRLLTLERSFSAHVSHEFRSSLMLISLAVANIRQVGKTQEAQDVLEKNCNRIKQANQQMTDNIELFLQLGSDRSKTKTYSPVNISEIFFEVKQGIEALRAETNTLHLSSDDSGTLVVNPVFLQVLFKNTLLNAMEHGTGDITVGLNQSTYRITNAIDAESINEGSGYGLEIVRRICEHNGWQMETPQENQQFKLLVKFK